MTELESYIHHHFSIALDDCQKVSGLFKIETINKGGYFYDPENIVTSFVLSRKVS
jgi:hypothetical protein